jgi:hypothetical protein
MFSRGTTGRPWSRGRVIFLGAIVVVAGIFAAPQPAQAYGIGRCATLMDIAQTWYKVQCEGSFLDSDTYAAHIRCNGNHYSSGNVVTPLFGGWGDWASVRCPSGQRFSDHWYTTSD